MGIQIPETPRRTESQERDSLALYDRIEALINEVTQDETHFLYNSQINAIFMDRLASSDPAGEGHCLGEIDLFGLPTKEVWDTEDRIKSRLKDAPRGAWLILRKGFQSDDGDVIFFQPMVAIGCQPRSEKHGGGIGLGSSDHLEARPSWGYVYDRMIEGDVAGARTWLREDRVRLAVLESATRLSLAPGQMLGTLVFNDGKVTRACEVKAIGMNGHGVILHGRRGSQLVQLTTNTLSIDGAIRRAETEGRRDGANTHLTVKPSSPSPVPAVRMR